MHQQYEFLRDAILYGTASSLEIKEAAQEIQGYAPTVKEQMELLRACLTATRREIETYANGTDAFYEEYVCPKGPSFNEGIYFLFLSMPPGTTIGHYTWNAFASLLPSMSSVSFLCRLPTALYKFGGPILSVNRTRGALKEKNSA